ncbi:MAG: hypothetical protein AAF984_11155, partial [Verrucomicrobiota bacterium]
ANPVYLAYCEACGMDAPPAKWHQFPALPVNAFRHQNVTSHSNANYAYSFRTSGTTSEQTGRHMMLKPDFYSLSLRQSFAKNFPDISRHHWVSFIPRLDQCSHSSLAFMISDLQGYIDPPCIDWLCDGDFNVDWKACLKVLEEKSKSCIPTAIFTTSFVWADLIDYLEKETLTLPLHEDSVLFETGGYKGRHVRTREEIIHRLEKIFHITPEQIYYEYGMTELSSQCYAKATDESYIAPPWMKVQIIDPSTNKRALPGQMGLLHFYDLANVYSCAAIATQDCGYYTKDTGHFILSGRTPSAPARGCSLAYKNN